MSCEFNLTTTTKKYGTGAPVGENKDFTVWCGVIGMLAGFAVAGFAISNSMPWIAGVACVVASFPLYLALKHTRNKE